MLETFAATILGSLVVILIVVPIVALPWWIGSRRERTPDDD